MLSASAIVSFMLQHDQGEEKVGGNGKHHWERGQCHYQIKGVSQWSKNHNMYLQRQTEVTKTEASRRSSFETPNHSYQATRRTLPETSAGDQASPNPAAQKTPKWKHIIQTTRSRRVESQPKHPFPKHQFKRICAPLCSQWSYLQ